MYNENEIKALLLIEDALMLKDWDSESDVINYVNAKLPEKIVDVKVLGELIAMVSRQLKHNYPIRCFIEECKEV